MTSLKSLSQVTAPLSPRNSANSQRARSRCNRSPCTAQRRAHCSRHTSRDPQLRSPFLGTETQGTRALGFKHSLVKAQGNLSHKSVAVESTEAGADLEVGATQNQGRQIPSAKPGKAGVMMSAGEDWAVFDDGSLGADSPEGSIFGGPAPASSSGPDKTTSVEKDEMETLAKPAAEDSSLVLFGVRMSDLPDRYITVAKASLAFVLANMDKVNLSVAIIPMSHFYGWNASTAGLVQSSFFWGYALSLIPSGWMATKFTGQRVLKGGVIAWSVATAIVPLCADSLPLLLLSRVLVGFGEGVAPPAATDLVARLMPASERTRAVSAVFNGFNVGSIMGLILSPILIERFGWQSVFYLFGAAGVLWSLGFNPPNPEEQAQKGTQERSRNAEDAGTEHLLPASMAAAAAEKGAQFVKGLRESVQKLQVNWGEGTSGEPVPWREILGTRAVWALVYIHFCNNWGHFCILAWLPTFYNDGLHMNLGQSALVSMVPPVMSLLVSAVVAPLADKFVQSGTDVTLVRKVAQGTAFMVPTFCIGIIAYAADLGLPQWAVVSLLSVGLGFSACAYAGLYCAHQDMSKKYASILLGLSTTVGAIPGIVGVPLTGVLYDHTNSWMLSLFLPSIFFYVTGTVVWSLFGDCRPQAFEKKALEAK